MSTATAMVAEGNVRVLTLGAARGPVAASLAPASLPPRPHVAAAALVRMRALAALHRGGYDAVHVADVRLAGLGRWIRRRTGYAVSVDAGPQDLAALAARPRLAAAVDALDAAFVFGEDGERALRTIAPRVPATALPLVGLAPESPPAAVSARMDRALALANPLRPLVALPWTPDAEAWQAVGPLVRLLGDAGAVCIAAGVPRGRAGDVRRWTEAPRLRAHTGPLRDAEVSALARCADVFVVPWKLARAAPAADDLARIALAASGVPVVASDAGSDVLAHERNGFLVRDGDLAGYRATIARLLDLPARQRHFMGAEFAAWTLRRWPVDAAVETYDSRLRALSGRVEIPFELRAAA